MATIRPRTKYKLAKKSRVCGKCGAKLNNQRVRCKKCSAVVGMPVKSRKKKRKARMSKIRLGR